ncbi:hypothetical protein C8J57DRAFT_1231308 [Mycena rebaudengoi]|nr:hypothetical protein C8J57DRAFT_1231308 [Mycena rebaudengoi]
MPARARQPVSVRLEILRGVPSPGRVLDARGAMHTRRRGCARTSATAPQALADTTRAENAHESARAPKPTDRACLRAHIVHEGCVRSPALVWRALGGVRAQVQARSALGCAWAGGYVCAPLGARDRAVGLRGCGASSSAGGGGRSNDTRASAAMCAFGPTGHLGFRHSALAREGRAGIGGTRQRQCTVGNSALAGGRGGRGGQGGAVGLVSAVGHSALIAQRVSHIRCRWRTTRRGGREEKWRSALVADATCDRMSGVPRTHFWLQCYNCANYQGR